MSGALGKWPWLLLLLAAGGAVWMLQDAAGPDGTSGLEGLEDDPEDASGLSGAEGRGADEAVDALPRLIGLGRPEAGGEGGRDGRVSGGAGGAAAAGAGGAGDAAQVRCGGRVCGPGGRPAAGVTLQFLGAGQGLVVTTDERGRFQTTLPAGRYGLVIRAEGYGGLRLANFLVDGATGTDLELQLQKTARVDVAVERDGVGVGGLPVALHPQDGVPGGPETGTTDASGQATFLTVVVGTYRLEVQLADAQVLTRRVEVKRDERLAFELPAAVRVRGRVASADDDRPIPAAEVTAAVRGPSGSWLASRTTSDDAGLFELEVAQGAVGRFEVVASGWVPWPDRKTQRSVLQRLRGVADGKEAEIEARLVSGLSIEGRVSDPAGKPVAGITLRFAPRRGPALEAVTDEEGDYQVSGATPQRYDVVVLTPGYFGPGGQNVVVPDLPPGGAFRADLEVVPTLSVTGVVLRPDGGAAAGARVWAAGGGRVLRAAHDQGRDLETFCDGQGRWRLDDLPANLRLTLRAALGALEARPRGLDTANLPDGTIRLLLARTVALKGRVVDLATRQPIQGARVEVRPRGGPGGRSGQVLATREDGTFEADDLIPGGWDLVPSSSGYLPASPLSLDLAENEDERTVEIELDPGLTVAGLVLAEDGTPLAQAVVTITGTDRDDKAVARRDRTDAQGRFRIAGLVWGSYRLVVRRQGYRTASQEGLRGGEDRLRVTLTARP